MNYIKEYPIISILVIVLLVVSILFVFKVIYEHRLNKLLKDKHMGLRIPVEDSKGSTIRLLKSYGTATLLPIALVIGLVLFNPGLTESNDLFTSDITNQDDIKSIYESFNNKVGNVSDYNNRANSDDIYTDAEFMAPTAGNPNYDISEDDMLSTGVNIVSSTSKTIYVTRDQTVEVFNLDSEINDKQILEKANTIALSSIVIATEANNDNLYLFSNTNNNSVEINSIEDTDSQNIELLGEISGHYIDSSIIDNELIVITRTLIPFEESDITSSLAYYNINGTTKLASEDVNYINGTNPNSFINIYRIDLLNEDVYFNSLLTDYNSTIKMLDSEIILFADYYQFNAKTNLTGTSYEVESVDLVISEVSIDSLNIKETIIERGKLYNYVECTEFICRITWNDYSVTAYDVKNGFDEIVGFNNSMHITSSKIVIEESFDSEGLTIKHKVLNEGILETISYDLQDSDVIEIDFEIVDNDEVFAIKYIETVINNNEYAYICGMTIYEVDEWFNISNHIDVSCETFAGELFEYETIMMGSTLYIITNNQIHMLDLNELDSVIKSLDIK